jgi:drug/metabolite transporter (DMT)-like permease
LLKNNPIRKYIAFGFLYFGWGSLYFAIAIAVQTIPPFVLAGASSILAALMLMFLSRAPFPKLSEWKASAAPAFFMIALGNGAVVWGEQYIPSTITALILATEPAWLILLDRNFFKGPKISRVQAAGIFLGVLGVATLLIGSSSMGAVSFPIPNMAGVGITAILMAAGGWSLGSLMCRSESMPKNSAMAIALPVLMGGLILLVASFLSGEMSRFSGAQVSGPSTIAFWYIVVVSYVGTYWSYIWLLKNAPLAQVSSYAYVNPLIAAVLGVVIGRESLNGWVFAGGTIIVMAIFLILKIQKKEQGI